MDKVRIMAPDSALIKHFLRAVIIFKNNMWSNFKAIKDRSGRRLPRWRRLKHGSVRMILQVKRKIPLS